MQISNWWWSVGGRWRVQLTPADLQTQSPQSLNNMILPETIDDLELSLMHFGMKPEFFYVTPKYH